MKKVIKNIFSVWPFKKMVCWHSSRSCGKVALTFDDGPRKNYTKKVLEILKEENVSATFFLEGRWVEVNLDFIVQISAAGHEMCNHGYDHKTNEVVSQFRCGKSVLEQAGIKTKIFRPALGKIRIKDILYFCIKKINIILWSFDTHDSMRYEGKWSDVPDYSGIKGGDIILMHDDNPICIDELPQLINVVKRNGYDFVIISDMLNYKR